MTSGPQLVQVFDLSSEGVLLFDIDAALLLYANDRAKSCWPDLIALKEQPLPLRGLFIDIEEQLRQVMACLIAEPTAKVARVLYLDHEDEIIPCEARFSCVEFEGKQCMVMFSKLLSSGDESHSLARMNQIYSILSETNKVVANSQTRTDLFESICRIAVEMGGFKMAWIGISHGKQVIPVCWFGDDQGYVKDLRVRIDDTILSQGPVGQAIITGKIRSVNDTKSDEGFAPWREAAMARKFRSLAALPIRIRGKTIGVFGLYSTVPNYFDLSIMDLLEDMANDLSLGLRHIDEETKRIEMEAKYRQLFQAIEHSATAVTITDDSGVIEYVNPQFCSLTGYKPEDILGLTPKEMASQNAQQITYHDMQTQLLAGKEWKGELQNVTKDGRLIWTLQHIAPIRDNTGKITHFVSTASDITELHDAQKTIEKLAYFDELTGLPNRRLFYDRLGQAIKNAARDKAHFALCYLDLDGFKNINDSLGHEAGDVLLQEVARRLQANIRDKDTVARLGGDEFTLILTDVKRPKDVAVVAQNIITSLANPVAIVDTRVVVTTSIGIALYTDDGETVEDLTRNADMAMYHAKGAGRNNYQFFTPDMNHKVQARMDMELRLRRAIEQKHFDLKYQPIIDAVDGSIIAVEALLEWQDPERGLIPTELYLPLAEETGLIAEIGVWMLNKACDDSRSLNERAVTPIKLSVDISSHQFRHPRQLLENLAEALERSGTTPQSIQLEINESILSRDVKTSVETLRKIRNKGITLAVDNFGMGYSSLRYLKRFPVDIIKIDRSFVRDVGHDENDAAITSAIIALAHQLEFKVLAEGVETRKHLQFLERYWCDYLQGSYFCKPVTLDECIVHINKSFEQLS